MYFNDAAINNVFTFLDTIDLKPYLNQFKNKTIKELMDKLESDYPYTDDSSESLFDYVSEDEFIYYLIEKYKIKIKEHIEVKNYIS